MGSGCREVQFVTRFPLLHPVPRDKTQLSDGKDQPHHRTPFSFADAFQGKWVTILRAVWNPNPDVFPHFTVSDLLQPGSAYCLTSDIVDREYELRSGHIFMQGTHSCISWSRLTGSDIIFFILGTLDCATQRQSVSDLSLG